MMDQSIIVGIDVGTTKICTLIRRLEQDGLIRILGVGIEPSEGISLLPAFQGRPRAAHECLYWEHEGNRAVRCGQWKLVAVDKGPWELYDMRTDRPELHDLAGEQPDKLKELAGIYEDAAKRWGILPYAPNDKPATPRSAPAP